jgi:hypothetical protein
MVSATDPYGYILGFLDWSRYYLFKSSSSIVLMILSWSPFQTHNFSKNLVAPGKKPGTFEFGARHSDH